MRTYVVSIARNWHTSLLGKEFREKLIWGIIIIIIISFLTHYFFDYNEYRKGGVVLNDWVLDMIPPENVSVPITLLMSSVVLLFLIRTITNPEMFITSLIAYILILTFRIITIAITHFQAPPELIALQDPISNLVYGSKFIIRDLFFSGHVATACLVYLCLYKKADRYYMGFVIFTVAILLLIQHVHYTIDIICAPLFAFGGMWLSKRIMRFQYANDVT